MIFEKPAAIVNAFIVMPQASALTTDSMGATTSALLTVLQTNHLLLLSFWRNFCNLT